jgi:hypothetical protein
MTVATLAYSTSTHRAGVLNRIARVAAAGRVAAERQAVEARAAREAALVEARAARVLAGIREDFPGVEDFGVKVCEEDGKWRAIVSADQAAWLVASVGDVEFWPVPRAV